MVYDFIRGSPGFRSLVSVLVWEGHIVLGYSHLHGVFILHSDLASIGFIHFLFCALVGFAWGLRLSTLFFYAVGTVLLLGFMGFSV